MSIESSMGWWRALRWERRRTEINDYCSAEQPRRTESHQGKDAGSLRTYIALRRSRESSRSLVTARVLGSPPPRTVALPRKRSSTALLPTSPPTSSRCFAGSRRARALVCQPSPSAAAAAYAHACCLLVARPPPPLPSLPRPLRLWRAGRAPGACAAHPARWRCQPLAVFGTQNEPALRHRAAPFTFPHPLMPRRPPK